MPRHKVDMLPGEQIQQLQNNLSSAGPTPSEKIGWEIALVEAVCITDGQYMHHDDPVGIGYVKFRRLSTDGSKPFNKLEWAKPFNSTNEYPIRGEFVTVISGPSNVAINTSYLDSPIPRFYYMGPVNYKQHINDNAFEAPVGADFVTSPAKSATAMEEQSDMAVDEVEPEVDNASGLAFNKAFNIFPLQPLEGDSIIQGRWGNSIRLSTSQINPEGYGETDPTKGFLDNPWSDNEEKYGEDPILIIRNGQSEELRDTNIDGEESPGHIFENLKEDKTGIWLTDGQTINSLREVFDDTSDNGPGVATTTQIKDAGLGNMFTDWGKATPQAIIASDRIIFMAKDDEVLLFGKNGIGLASDNDIVIESADTITLSAPVIELAGEVKYGIGGGKAINGEKLIELLEDLIDEVMSMGVITATGPGTASPSSKMQSIKDQLADTLSSGDDQA